MTQAPYPTPGQSGAAHLDLSHRSVRVLAIVAVVLAIVVTIHPIVAGAAAFIARGDALGSWIPFLALLTGLFGAIAPLCSLGLLVLGILIIVLGRGRARTGGIMIVVAVALSFVLGFGFSAIFAVVQNVAVSSGTISSGSLGALTTAVVISWIIGGILGVVAIIGARRTLHAAEDERGQ